MTGPTTAPRLKVALLSFAHTHAHSYLRHLCARDDVELLTADPEGAAASDAGPRGAEFAADYGVRYVDSYEEALAWQPQAVIICAENSRHLELVRKAAAVGADILCEKPLATSAIDAKSAVDASDAAAVQLMIAFPVRFSPAYRELKERVRAGQLGDVLSVVGTNNGWMPTDRSWFTDPELAGGGALVDHVVHCADLLDDLLGLPVLSVRAVTNRILHADTGVRVETGGMVNLTYDGGIIATIDCSWSQPASAPTWGGLTLQVTGTKGSIKIDPFASHVGGYDSRGALWLPFGADLDALMLERFLDMVQTGDMTGADGRGGLRTVQIVNAAQESARTGQPVRLRSEERTVRTLREQAQEQVH
ncbi:Gfo/Idh/MocA family oxidoreductase [Paenarthrobacter sp. Z7-10]|uniref:Gfo/Idh/MocA family protein n=1 Tax=Paenarthrobacter sp. Z7-10 TaxID=2787635 RepID=UPI0022A9EA8E|nr:Gfo/Idh/MocA family oxidoreductase [Paenarthrobacter sp. Z7-10]MCZ2402888.1 Gfo/Idh/MocA family oxidoreductase [Paenarthrobacter sp. Z7-10]